MQNAPTSVVFICCKLMVMALCAMLIINCANRVNADARHEIVGTWLSNDNTRRLVVFRSDGTCSVGWDNKGNISRYTVSASGDVETTTRGEGGFLAVEHFWLKKGILCGIRGGFGNPRVTFRKQPRRTKHPKARCAALFRYDATPTASN